MATASPQSAAKARGDDRETRLLARFTGAPSLTAQQYDQTIRQLEASGEWPPDGLAYHIAFRSNGKFRVSEVWDSREQFDAFGKRLRPVLAKVGVELSGEPELLEIHNIVKR